MGNNLADAMMRRLNPSQGEIPLPRERPQPPRAPSGPYRAFGIGAPVQMAQAQVAPLADGSQDEAPPEGSGLPPPKKQNAFASVGGSSEPSTETLDLQKNEAEIHKQAIALYDAVKALDDIKRTYDPKFSDASFEAEQNWKNVKDRWKSSGIPDFLGFKPLTSRDKAVMGQYNRWRSLSSNLADVILRVRSGGATSEQEEVRMSKFLPNPGGEGFFGFMSLDADGRTRYIAKLDGLTRALKRSYMRRAWARKNGVPVERLSGEMGIFDSSTALPGDKKFHEFDPQNPQWHDAIKQHTAELLSQGLSREQAKRQVFEDFALGYQSDADRQQ